LFFDHLERNQRRSDEVQPGSGADENPSDDVRIRLRRMWALLVVGGGASFVGVAFVLTSLHHWFVHPERQASLLLIPLGATSILIGLALLLATTAVYVFGRNRIRTSSDGFSSAPEPG
jgi:protease PrsW